MLNQLSTCSIALVSSEGDSNPIEIKTCVPTLCFQVFDPVKMRTKGTEAEKFVAKGKHLQNKPMVSILLLNESVGMIKVHRVNHIETSVHLFKRSLTSC